MSPVDWAMRQSGRGARGCVWRDVSRAPVCGSFEYNKPRVANTDGTVVCCSRAERPLLTVSSILVWRYHSTLSSGTMRTISARGGGHALRQWEAVQHLPTPPSPRPRPRPFPGQHQCPRLRPRLRPRQGPRRTSRVGVVLIIWSGTCPCWIVSLRRRGARRRPTSRSAC